MSEPYLGLLALPIDSVVVLRPDIRRVKLGDVSVSGDPSTTSDTERVHFAEYAFWSRGVMTTWYMGISTDGTTYVTRPQEYASTRAYSVGDTLEALWKVRDQTLAMVRAFEQNRAEDFAELMIDLRRLVDVPTIT